MKQSVWILIFSFLVGVSSAKHTSNHAVIVSSSRYWFNYRHAINALTVYSFLKDNGFSDDNIILMLADDFPTNPRNIYKNQMYSAGVSSRKTLYDSDIEIDYRGEDVNVENLVRAMTGRTEDGLPALRTDEGSNILVFLTGHGGDQFFKFQDMEEIMATQLAEAFRQMYEDKKYNEILFMADTCQAFTLADKLESPNIIAIGSSLKGESSYAHHADKEIGLSVIERYSFAFSTFFENHKGLLSQMSLQQALIDPYSFKEQRAHIGARDDLSKRKLKEIPVVDFFRNIQQTAKRVEETSKSLFFVHNIKKLGSQNSNETVLQHEAEGSPLHDDTVEVEKLPEETSNQNFLMLLVVLLAFLFSFGRRF